MAKFWIKPPFQKKGMCKQRGTCCHNILLQWSPWYDKIPLLKKSILWWQTELNGFYVKKMEIFDEKSGTFSKVLGCRYLKKSGSCGHHFFRPSICRSWPRIEYFGLPIYLKGCGFYAKARNEKAKQWMESQQLAANKSKHKEKF